MGTVTGHCFQSQNNLPYRLVELLELSATVLLSLILVHVVENTENCMKNHNETWQLEHQSSDPMIYNTNIAADVPFFFASLLSSLSANIR